MGTNVLSRPFGVRGYTGHTLNEDSAKTIHSVTGMDAEYISRCLTLDDEIDSVRGKTGKKPMFSKKRKPWILGRGNPLVSRRRIKTIEEVEKALDEF